MPVAGAISSVTFSHYVTPSSTPTQVATFTVTADSGTLNLKRLVVPLLATDDGADTPSYDFAVRTNLDGFASNLWADSIQVPAGANQVAVSTADIDLSADTAFRGLDTITFAIYFSSDGKSWNEPVAKGHLQRGRTERKIVFDKAARGKFLRFVAASGIDGQKFASVAELELIEAADK